MKTIILRSALALVAAAGLTTFGSANAEASNAAQLVCESTGGSPGGALCDAYPFGAAGYSWSTSGGIRLTAGPPNAQSRQVTCQLGSSGGTVSVVVTHADGTQESKSRHVGCGPAF